MRFKATNENLTIQVSGGERAECVRRIVRHLVPHYTRKVYLYDIVRSGSLTVKEPGLTVVDATDLPSNLFQSFRVVVWPDELVVVSGQRQFRRSQWLDLAAELEAHAA